jgi:hypothetical protein
VRPGAEGAGGSVVGRDRFLDPPGEPVDVENLAAEGGPGSNAVRDSRPAW